MADISIIIPSYNRLWSLPKAIESCFEPGLAIEVIVVDDGSTDGTAEWLAQQSNITCLSQAHSGKDWAVNKGLSAASGKYIRFLDSDDWILPGSTGALYRHAEKNGLDVTCAGYLLVNETGETIGETPWTVCDDFLAQQLGECDSSHYSAYLFRKTFIGDVPHRQEYGAYDDRQFIIEVALKAPKTGFIQSPALAHRVHDQPRLQKAAGLLQAYHHQAYLNIFQNAASILQKRGQLTKRYKKAICNKIWPLAHWLGNFHPADGQFVYKWVYELLPDFVPDQDAKLHYWYQTLGYKNTEFLLKLKRWTGL